MKKDYSIKRTEEEYALIKFFFEENERQGLLPDFSSKELCDLHRRAMEGDYTSQLLMIEIYERLIPQLNQDILKQIREKKED